MSFIKQNVDLVSTLSEYVSLKKYGHLFKGLCPFHDEKTPSFTVKDGAQFYHCFGCGSHGDVISFLMNHLCMSFNESIQYLCDKHGFVCQDDGQNDEFYNVKKCLKDSEEFFHNCIFKNSKALDYMYERGFDISDVVKFKLGWSSSNLSNLYDFLKHNGTNLSVVKISGLFSSYGSFLFSNRILIPVHSSVNYTIGFVGRDVSNLSTQKYVNSSDNICFKKNDVFFNFHRAKHAASKLGELVVVEGPLDVIRLVQNGVDNVVAVMGTVFSSSHLEAIKVQNIQTVYLCFDCDSAGIQSCKKTGFLLLSHLIDVRIIELASGEDPDSFVLKCGIDEFLNLKSKAIDYITFLFVKDFHLHVSYVSKTSWINTLLDKFRSLNNDILFNQVVWKVEQLSGIPLDTVAIKRVEENKVKCSASLIIEREFLVLMLLLSDKYFSLCKIIFDKIHVSMFVNEKIGTWYKLLCDFVCSNDIYTLNDLLSVFNGNDGSDWFVKYVTRKKIIDHSQSKKCLLNIANQILQMKWKEEIRQIKSKIQSGRLSEKEASNMMEELLNVMRNQPTIPEN